MLLILGHASRLESRKGIIGAKRADKSGYATQADANYFSMKV